MEGVPGYRRAVLDSFNENGLIALGNFDVPGVGDLARYPDKASLRAAGLSVPGASQLWLLAHEIRVGDRLVAYAKNHILGHGEVTGEYRYGDDNDYWLGENYLRDVRWEPPMPRLSIHRDPILWGKSPGGGPFTRNITLVKLGDEHVRRILELFERHGVETTLVPPAGVRNEEPPSLGQPYIRANETVSPRAPAPFEVDPERVERGTGAHRVTQNALYDHLVRLGMQPFSPTAGEPEYDLAWESNGCLFVAEVKSITDENEDKQLRLGLGQVLWYRHLLARYHSPVVAVLVAEREPANPEWKSLCRELKVRLAWQGAFERLTGGA